MAACGGYARESSADEAACAGEKDLHCLGVSFK
jgi:hypothetical protein